MKHVLIVDDSSDQRMLLKMLLEARGYTVECTPNGQEALKVLRLKDEMPQTILLDLNMDVMGGFEFRELQLADPILRDIPVIVMSGEDNVAAVKARTKTEVVQKPLTISKLMELLQRNAKPRVIGVLSE